MTGAALSRVRRLLVVGCLTALGVTACGGGASPAGSSSADASGGSGPSSSGASWGQIPQVVDEAEPFVVTVFVKNGLGSGVIWSSDGTIVTDAHVACGTDTPAAATCVGGPVKVQFADGKQSTGTVRAIDAVTDVAVVQVHRSSLPAATFARSLPEVGQLNVVIGSPLGLQETVTAGIVSALHRNLPAGKGQLPLVDLVQTDAPISPGNSGGAVVDAHGKVIGLSEAYLPPQSGAVAIGFYTPSTTVVPVVQQLLRTGHADHAYLGVQETTLTPQIASRFGLQQTSGVLVIGVQAGTAAAHAGLQRGDIITAVGGHRVQTEDDLFAVLLRHAPGDTVGLAYVRDGHRHTTRVTLGSRPTG